jgi:hypothetical protein
VHGSPPVPRCARPTLPMKGREKTDGQASLSSRR